MCSSILQDARLSEFASTSDGELSLPSSVSFAILIPTVRWSPTVRSIVGSMLGVANQEVAVLIGDNSENIEKRAFLSEIQKINPNIYFVSHEKNIGSFQNFLFLHDWCKNIEFSAIIADDDFISPDYHQDGYHLLTNNPQASCATCGVTLVDVGDGKKVDVTQKSMLGTTPANRMRLWSASAARVTMYDVSRRRMLDNAIEYHRQSPLKGVTLLEDLWELSRLSQGEYLATPGHGLYVHYPATRTIGGDETERFYNLLFRDVGLSFPFVYFGSLSTAVQCAIFLLGRFSPIHDISQRHQCAQMVFNQIFKQSFLPNISGDSSQHAISTLFGESQRALEGFARFCKVSNNLPVEFNNDVLNWFIEIIKVLETKNEDPYLNMSFKFEKFAQSIMNIDAVQTEVP